jgi:hypothetical protein
MKRSALCICPLLLLLIGSMASAYYPEAHFQIMERASEKHRSILHRRLVLQLGVDKGVRHQFPGTISGRTRALPLFAGLEVVFDGHVW